MEVLISVSQHSRPTYLCDLRESSYEGKSGQGRHVALLKRSLCIASSSRAIGLQFPAPLAVRSGHVIEF